MAKRVIETEMGPMDEVLPYGLAVDGDGNVIVADAQNCCIRNSTPQGHVTTLAGTDEPGLQDGDPVAFAQFKGPYGVAVDENGNVIGWPTRGTTAFAVSPLMV
jgi:DNA-binding beta-propeller fold protein YncE